jgi:hypothetical protein
MKQAPCNGDLFFAPTDGDIICTGIADASSIVPGTVCKILCTAAYATPDVITCATSGWDTELVSFFCQSLTDKDNFNKDTRFNTLSWDFFISFIDINVYIVIQNFN